MVKFDIFFETLKEKKVSSYKLIQQKIISPNTVQRFKNNLPTTTDTIDKICDYLNCTPDQVFTYTKSEAPNNETEETVEEAIEDTDIKE